MFTLTCQHVDINVINSDNFFVNTCKQLFCLVQIRTACMQVSVQVFTVRVDTGQNYFTVPASIECRACTRKDFTFVTKKIFVTTDFRRQVCLGTIEIVKIHSCARVLQLTKRAP